MAIRRSTRGASALDVALALNKKEVVQLSFDPLAAKRACKKGLEAIAEHRRLLMKGHPGIALAELDELPALCDLVLEAQRATQTLRKSGGDVSALTNRALVWRRRLMGLAQSLAEPGGSVDLRTLNKIEGGRGVTDNLQDVKDLCALLASQKAIVEAAHGRGALDEASTAAINAIAALGGTGAETPASREAAKRRDRLATLVIMRHDRLRAAAAVVLGYKEAALAVPPLGGASGGVRSVQEPPSPPSQGGPNG